MTIFHTGRESGGQGNSRADLSFRSVPPLPCETNLLTCASHPRSKIRKLGKWRKVPRPSPRDGGEPLQILPSNHGPPVRNVRKPFAAPPMHGNGRCDGNCQSDHAVLVRDGVLRPATAASSDRRPSNFSRTELVECSGRRNRADSVTAGGNGPLYREAADLSHCRYAVESPPQEVLMWQVKVDNSSGTVAACFMRCTNCPQTRRDG